MQLTEVFTVIVNFTTTDNVTTVAEYDLNHYPSDEEIQAVANEHVIDNAIPDGTSVMATVRKSFKGTV